MLGKTQVNFDREPSSKNATDIPLFEEKPFFGLVSVLSLFCPSTTLRNGCFSDFTEDTNSVTGM